MSSVASAAYRAGVNMTDSRTGIEHDYTKKRGVDDAVILAPENSPAWVADRSELWNAVETSEIRKDAQVAREVQLAIPCELSRDEGRAVVLDFVQDNFVRHGMVADVAFHNLDSNNPHSHVMLTTRRLDGEGFGNKAREWNDRNLAEVWRQNWASHANRALEKYGEKIDHRSFERQGIDAEPTIHLGKAAHSMQKRKTYSERAAINYWIKKTNNERKALLGERFQAVISAGGAESYRFECMTEAQQRAELKALRADLKDLEKRIVNDTEVVYGMETSRQNRQQIKDLIPEIADAEKKAKDAALARKEWEEEHHRRVWLHRKGIIKSQEYTQLIANEKNAPKRLENLKKQLEEKRIELDRIEARTVERRAELRNSLPSEYPRMNIRALASREYHETQEINQRWRNENAYQARQQQIRKDTERAIAENREREIVRASARNAPKPGM